MLHFIHHFSILCLNFGHHLSSHIGAFTLNFRQRGAITFDVNGLLFIDALSFWCIAGG